MKETHWCSRWRTLLAEPSFPFLDFRELKQRRWRRQRERQKSNRFDKQQLFYVHHVFFCTFLCRFCMTMTWKCRISRWQDVNTRQRLSFSFRDPSIQSFRIQLQKCSPNIWRIERDGIRAIEFEAARIHFLSDVFVTIAVVVASPLANSTRVRSLLSMRCKLLE